MATTRDFNSLGVWAEAAETVIPAEPIPGTAYRDETTTEGTNEAGEGFATDPNSATFNQRLFIISSFTDLMNTHGIVGWSNLVDYDIPAIVFADDGKFYYALQASGPSTAPQDPPGAPTFWEEVVTKQLLAENTGASLIGTPTGKPLSEFIPVAWAVLIEPDGVFNNGANFGFSHPAAHPDDGKYILTLNTAGTKADRFVAVTSISNRVASSANDTVTGYNSFISTDTTIQLESWDTTTGNFQDPGDDAGLSVMVYQLD